MSKKERLIWLDLEMTGLDAQKDAILEIATIVTEGDLSLVAHGPSLVIHQPEEAFENLNPWVVEQHTRSGLFDQVRASTLSCREAEQQTLAFLREWCEPGACPLAGNSIWCDRTFIQQYMPELASFLFYRIIDVSSFKEMILRWYPENSAARYVKKETHRALDDIEESIAELRHYKKHFFV